MQPFNGFNIPQGWPQPFLYKIFLSKNSFRGNISLGKTVEVLSLMLNNPRPNLPEVKYLEPIHHNLKKKKSRRRRTPSPVEFYIKEDDESNVIEIEDDKDEEAVNISQLDGADTDDSDSDHDDGEEEGSDDDFEPSHAGKVKPRPSRRKQSDSNQRVFSDNRKSVAMNLS